MKAFECKMCGECCYGKGGIKVTDIEVIKLSNYLKISPEEFRTQYCEARNSELMLVTGRDGFCIFFDPARLCLIHEVKPGICRLWPFYEANVNDEYNWNMARDACPGICRDATFMDFVKQGKR